MTTRRIALVLDDFGLHEGVNGAALALAARGLLSGVGCLVGAPAFAGGHAALKDLDPARSDTGLHLDLTEFPLLMAQHSLPALIARAYARALDRRRLRAEVDAQLDAFESALGRSPDFVDGHQHVHQLPQVREALVEALARRAGPRRPWLRDTRRPAGAGWRYAGLKPLVIESLGAEALRRLAARGPHPQNAHLLGVYDFRADAASYRSLLAGWLAQASDGDVLMCHASLPCEASDGLLPARTVEAAVLLGPEFEALLAQAGVELQPISAWARRQQSERVAAQP